VVEPHSGLAIQQVRLPCTKGTPQGKPVYWAKQPSSSICPKLTLENHLLVNCHGDKFCPLTKSGFDGHLKDIQKAAKRAKDPLVLPTAHAFRIGGTLEHLLQGLDFITVKVKG
jgi:hypothetical protein